MRRALLVLLAVLVATACDGDDAPTDASADSSRDGGPDGTTPDAGRGFVIAPPAPAALPDQAPCPEGWVESTDEGVTVCLPWVDGTPPSCTGATFAPPGEASCVPVGDPCPTGDFPDGPAGPEVVHVRVGATGGDGSRAAPYGTLAEVGTLEPGAVVLLSKGTHEITTTFSIPADVTVRGTCTAETIVTRTAGASFAFAVSATGAMLSDLTLRDLPGIGLTAFSGGEVTVERVFIDGATQVGLRARSGSTVTARSVLIRDVRGRLSDDANGFGIAANEGASMSVERAVLEEARRSGVLVTDEGSRMSLDRVAVLHTLGADVDGAGGTGILASLGAELTGRAVAVVDAYFAGLGALSAGTVAECDHCFISGVSRQRSSGDYGDAVSVLDGASLMLTRSVVEAGYGRGVWSGYEPSVATLADCLVRDIVPEEGGEQGRGVHASRGGRLTAQRLAILRTVGHAVSATSASSYEVQDTTIVDVAPRELDGAFGRGFSAVDGSSASISRATINGHHDIAVMVAASADMVVSDLLVGPPEPGLSTDGRVIQAQESATGTFSRIAASGFRYAAVTCVQDTTCTLSDVSFLNGYREELTWARGLLTLDATVDVERMEVVSPTSLGIGLLTSNATIRDVEIADVARCEVDCTYVGGTGVFVNGGSVTIDGFAIDGASLCGVHLADMGELDLNDGTVSGSQIGVCVFSEGYDLMRLSSGVVFSDNTTNLDTLTLPTPSVSDALGTGGGD